MSKMGIQYNSDTLLHRDTCNGQAMTEFAIVFPVMILLFLVIIQTSMMMTAKLIVNYAAYCSARSAVVYHDSPDYKMRVDRAADMACISISPMITYDIIAELTQYAMEAITIPAKITLNLKPRPLGYLFEKEHLPGIDIVNNLITNGIPSPLSNSNLPLGIALITQFCGQRYDIPQRYLASALLSSVTTTSNDNEITAEVTFHYPMRVPIVNKLFFYLYLHSSFTEDIQNYATKYHIPDAMVEVIRKASFDSMLGLSDASDSLPLYLLPIRAKCTLPAEIRTSGPSLCNN